MALPPLFPGAPSYPPTSEPPSVVPQPLQHPRQLPAPPAQAGPNAPRARPLSPAPAPAPAPQVPVQSYLPPSSYSPMSSYGAPQLQHAPPSPYPPTSYATPRPTSYQHPVPPPQFQYAPVPAPQIYQSPAEIAAAKYHAELVAYYLSFAMQAVVAPVENERQTRARHEAIETAMRAGVTFAPGPCVPPVPAAPVQRGSESWRSPLPSAPVRTRTLPQPVASPLSPHSAASFFAYAPVPQQDRFSPLPPTTPQPQPMQAPQIYTPPVTLERSTSARQQPFFPPVPPSQLNRSTSAHAINSVQFVQQQQALPRPSAAASPSLYVAPSPIISPTMPSTHNPPPSLSQRPGVPLMQTYQSQLGRSASVASASSSYAGSNVSIASTSSTGAAVGQTKRPLPKPPVRGGTLPPGVGAGVPAPAPSGFGPTSPRPLPKPAPRGPTFVPPQPRRAPEDLLREKMASVSFQPPDSSGSDRGSTPTPPLLEFTVPDARPRSPSISITPAFPTSHTSQPPPHPSPQNNAPHPPPRSLVHPRHDPSHPSHELYHPSSSTPLEAGAVRCARCKETMFGRALMAFGAQWHPDCFRCDEEGCGTLLEHVQFDGRDGKIYCMVHFEELFASTCHQCKTPIADEDFLTIDDPSLLPSAGPRSYHALHFFCASCGDPFVDPKSLAKGREGTLADPYVVHDGYAYCRRCDVRLYKPKCKGCRKGVGGDFVEALDGIWHEECFICSDCKRPLDGQYLLKNDQAFCVNCYEVRIKNEGV